jgi:hypothetical protein
VLVLAIDEGNVAITSSQVHRARGIPEIGDAAFAGARSTLVAV